MSPKRKKSGEERKKQTSLQRAAWPGAKKKKKKNILQKVLRELWVSKTAVTMCCFQIILTAVYKS